jgi:hypothetical protein
MREESVSILIMYSAERVGDSLVEYICNSFTEMGGASCECVNSDLPEVLNTLDPERNKPDIVLVLESMDAFISHRLRIGGRPWVLAASFTFDDVYTLYSNTMAITEIGIDAFVSNCAVFLKNMTAMIPSNFCWRPVTKVPSGPHGVLIGTVLDNLLDRDFSLVDHAFKVLEANDLNSKAVVYCHRRIDRDRLPERLAKYAVDKFAADSWHSLKYYLPAPRITDLRGGVVPPEILKALAYGCHPLCFGHNALPALGRIFTPQFTCLKSFESGLLDAASGNFETHLVAGDSTSWRPSVESFCRMVKQMYRRAQANASS